VHANLLAAEAPAECVSGQVMNTATGVRNSLNEAFRILRELTGYRGDPAYAPARPGDIRDSQADISRAVEWLGYAPVVDFREGLRRTVEWYRASGVTKKNFVSRKRRVQRVASPAPALA
jgi:nucleoside-diphosphate-sugar epimerase